MRSYFQNSIKSMQQKISRVFEMEKDSLNWTDEGGVEGAMGGGWMGEWREGRKRRNIL